MSVLINKKRCDNAEECSCIAVCPVNAFYWNEEAKTIAVNDTLCINCRQCMLACEAGAVKVARNDEEYQQIKNEYDEDLMTIEELFQDRYGAALVDEKYDLNFEELDNLIKSSNKCLLIEFYDIDNASCLINSIPINEIINSIQAPISYRKINVSNIKLLAKYDIKELPTLMIIRSGNVVFKQDGFVSVDKKERLLNELKCI